MSQEVVLNHVNQMIQNNVEKEVIKHFIETFVENVYLATKLLSLIK